MNYKLKDVFKKPDIKMMCMIGIMIAIEVVTHRMLGIQTPIVQIHFGFIPIVVVALLYGPFYSGLAWAIADTIGTLLFPTGAFFPGFTITAFISGVIFGIFLYKSKKTILNTILAVLIVNIFMTLALDMYWIYVISGQTFIALLPSRLIKCAVMIPTQIIAILLIKKHDSILNMKKTPS
jgi:Predicted membrane protein